MDFPTFYCGIREYFSSHKTDFEGKAQIKVISYLNNAKGTVGTKGLKYDLFRWFDKHVVTKLCDASPECSDPDC